MSNIDKPMMDDLIRRQKQLYHDDFNGITASDARHMIADWLEANGHPREAARFNNTVIKYLDTKKFLEAERRYDAL